MPAIEKRFRGIGAGWARGVFGGSTGGWESAATMVAGPCGQFPSTRVEGRQV